MVSLRLLMMGTGTFALPTFRALCASGHDVVGLVTQPDREGRGHHHHPHPMKEAAVELGVPVFQPENVNSPEALDVLRTLRADAFIVAAYGQILSAELLGIPRLGAMNLHGSILPAYRGAAPIQYAVWRGETETGVTMFRIEPKLDAGPILGIVRTPIGPQETSGEVHDRLAELSAPFAIDVLERLEAGTIEPMVQDRSKVSKAPKIQKEQGLIDWSRTRSEIDCHIRAMQPWPMPFSFLQSHPALPMRVQILAVRSLEPTSTRLPSGEPGSVQPGEDGHLMVCCGDGVVEVLTIQPSGKRPMSAADFLRGHPLSTNARFVGAPT
ncbi:MAG: methionyl-tRNA formyltransferase [Planctomycetaceae bacterium]